jgi:hypothetical protein
MISATYDFQQFLDAMAGMDYYEILVKAEQECASAERKSYGVRGAPRQREMGSTVYARDVKRFLFFMRTGTKPDGVTEWDFAAYKPVCEALVEKGQFLPSILSYFK